MTEANRSADLQLYKRAADALVRWRRLWVAKNDSDEGPKAEMGFDCDEEKLWKIAGQIMKHRNEDVHPQFCEYHGGTLPCADCVEEDAEERAT